MDKKHILRHSILLMCLALSVFSGCAQIATSIGDQGTNVWIVVDWERIHFKDKLTTEDRGYASEVSVAGFDR